MKILILWLAFLLTPAAMAAPPPTDQEVVVIQCLISGTHFAVVATSTSAELDPAIFATGDCAVVLANLMNIGYELFATSGNDSGGASTIFTLVDSGK